MNSIHIVTHCYAATSFWYAILLRFHLNSIRMAALQGVQVRATICCYEGDELTNKTLKYYRDLAHWKPSILQLSLDRIGRRSIGRNIVALGQDAGIVWFTDVDHVFTAAALDNLSRFSFQEGVTMVFPRQINIHRDHEMAIKTIERETSLQPIIDRSEFVVKSISRAIGGLQIVPGAFARTHGYLDSRKRWQRPTSQPFDTFVDDVVFRGHCSSLGRIIRIDLSGVYRMRHPKRIDPRKN